MIKTIDNFLNNSDLQFLKSFANDNVDFYTLKKLGNSFINFNCQSGNENDMKNVLGVLWVSILSKVKTSLRNIISSDLLLYSIKISVTTESYVMHKHLDDRVHGRSLDKSYTCIIYLTDHWVESMGGLWDGGNELIVPHYNKLLVYSRDIAHSVTSSLTTWPNHRTILLTSWCSH